MTEFALIFPLAMLVILAIIVIGLWVFYQQQVTNVAREGARFAAIHSSEALCPTASWRDPQAPLTSYPEYPLHCDGPNNPNDPYPWPKMTDHVRALAWGLPTSAVHINACWSGYVPSGTPVGSFANYSDASGFPQADHPPVNSAGISNTFVQCTIDGTDPVANTSSLDCTTGMTTSADDPASDNPGNQVTVYACYDWAPPLAGVLMIPSQVTLRAVISETIHNQQG